MRAVAATTTPRSRAPTLEHCSARGASPACIAPGVLPVQRSSPSALPGANAPALLLAVGLHVRSTRRCPPTLPTCALQARVHVVRGSFSKSAYLIQRR